MNASLDHMRLQSERRRMATSFLLAVVALALGAFAQWRLDRKQIGALSLLAYGLAGVLFAVTLGDIPAESQQDAEAAASLASEKLAQSATVLATLLGVALLGCLDFGGNRFRPLGLALWGGGLSLCLAYLYMLEAPPGLAERAAMAIASRPWKVSREMLLLLGAVLAGAVLRLRQLDAIPADIGWDLPYNYAKALAILRGQFSIFFPANQAGECLFYYLSALVARLSTLSHFSIKLSSALVGMATIPVLYLAGRRLFNSKVGLVSAYLLAFNRWHVILSRSGFRVILLPFFVILVLYTMARALQTKRTFDCAVAGVTLGLGMYSYTSFACATLAVGAVLGIRLALSAPQHRQSLLGLAGLMVAVALVAYAPLARFALENPAQYLSVQARVLNDPGREPMTLSLLLENVRTSLLMYHAYGDPNVRFNVPFARHFGFVSGVLLVLGLACVARSPRRTSHQLLLVMFFSLIIPMTLAMRPREMPNLFRSAGTLGPALILAALPLWIMATRLRALAASYPLSDFWIKVRSSVLDRVHELALPIGRRQLLTAGATLAVALLLAAECRETRLFYFRDLVEVLPDQHNVSIAREMSRQIEAYGDKWSCYIKVWPHWYDGRALKTYLREVDEAWNPEFSELLPGQPPLSTIGERALIMVHPSDTTGLEALREAFPHHATVLHTLPEGTPAFIAVFVER